MLILFVCTGNINRSPFAEHLAAKLALDAGWEDVHFASAGTHASLGYGSPVEAMRAAQGFGVNLLEHRARQVDADQLARADLVVVMSPDQGRLVRSLQPALDERRVQNLADYSPGPFRPPYVPDPHGGELWAFQACYRFIEACVRSLLDAIQAQREPLRS